MAGKVKRETAHRTVKKPAPGGEPPKTQELALRPSQCRAYMRQTLAREFRGIVHGFVEGAKTGSCQHVKLVAELLEPLPRRRSRGKGTVQQLLEKLEHEAQ